MVREKIKGDVVMNEHLRKIYLRFLEHFGYCPNFPDDIYIGKFNQDEYADLLEKCIQDNFDYTIELYGTDPEYGTQPDDGICID